MAENRSRHLDNKTRVGDGLPRCEWPADNDELYLAYHDNAWGIPEYDDKALFAKLILDGFQAGLSWIVILRKEESFRQVFHNLDPHILATLSDDELEIQMQNKDIVRNRAKIFALRTNAQAYLKLHQEMGFANYWWGYVNNKPIDRKVKSKDDYLSKCNLSETISKDLKKRGFKFIGPTIVYAFMQAVGLINDHLVTCHSHQKCVALTKENFNS